MRVTQYARLLAENGFRVHPTRWPMMALVGGCTLFNSFWSFWQSAFWRRAIDAAELAPPTFVIGHWRSGTTLLHELLALDPQFAYPANYDCFVPDHFLVTHRFLAPILGWFLPRQRPMDDMPISPRQPQEDEFAVLAMGGPTPYRRIAFPNRGPVAQDLLDFDSAPSDSVAAYQESMVHFFRCLSLRYSGKPLILKSPPHTGRIRKLADWFPGARFIHIARDPVKVARSTLKLWSSLDAVQGFQLARYSAAELESFVHDSQRRMYRGYFAQRAAIPPERLVQIRFEDLLADPSGTLGSIYTHFGWSDFETLQPRIEQYFHERKSHRIDDRAIEAEFAARVAREWAEYREAFGYDR